jgi:uncharacterized DUF497 family protein
VDPTRFDLQWDPVKAKQNLSKHGVSFGQAATVLLDPLAVNLYDDEHSRDEERWVTLGRSAPGTILVVVHTFDEQPDGNITVRIISARRAVKREQQRYEATP